MQTGGQLEALSAPIRQGGSCWCGRSDAFARPRSSVAGRTVGPPRLSTAPYRVLYCVPGTEILLQYPSAPQLLQTLKTPNASRQNSFCLRQAGVTGSCCLQFLWVPRTDMRAEATGRDVGGAVRKVRQVWYCMSHHHTYAGRVGHSWPAACSLMPPARFEGTGPEKASARSLDANQDPKGGSASGGGDATTRPPKPPKETRQKGEAIAKTLYRQHSTTDAYPTGLGGAMALLPGRSATEQLWEFQAPPK